MRRPGLWTANGRPTDPSKMLSWVPGAVTCFQDYLGPNKVAEYKSTFPGVDVIVRFQHPKNWMENITESAKNHANELLSKWPEIKDLSPYVYFANELNLHYESGDNNPASQPQFETKEFYQKCAQWTKEVADRIKATAPDMRLVMHPWAFGHGEDGAPDDLGNPKAGWAGYDYFALGIIATYFDNIITFHGYWGTGAGSNRDMLYQPELSSWYAFRWRRILKLFAKRYGSDVKVIIDEAGNFGAADLDFTDQTLYYSSECLKDPRVLALTFFLWEDPTNSPGNLPNSWVQRVVNLDQHLERMAKFSLDVPVANAIRVKMADTGVVRTLDLEREYLPGVVPSEMPAASWGMDALKAQAVWARSYAMHRRDERANKDFDVWSDARDQVYNPARIHERSTAAVRDTTGKYLVGEDGKPFLAQYVSRCGTVRCLYCMGQGGYVTEGNPDGVWLSRGCQYGAEHMAKLGSDWKEIATFYYTPVKLN